MEIFNEIVSIQQFIKAKKCQGTIGFVPTMGALHQGHLSLIEASKLKDSLTICSIFVNPKQFNNPEDLEKYPRSIEKDLNMLEKHGCDAIFLPSVEEMYGKEQGNLHFSFGYLEQVLEGRYRPGHFNGVGIVVLKLLNIVTPDRAYFGQKDLQQFVIINNMVKELNFQVELQRMPIIREEDGLAMSSRNIRLEADARNHALIFSRALRQSKDMLLEGVPIKSVKQHIASLFAKDAVANLEYFEIVNAQSLMPVTDLSNSGETAICIAGYVDGVRLIDNVIF